VKELQLRLISPLQRSGARTMVPAGDQCRCACGSMLARVVREGLELKCRKCKALVIISHEELVEMYRALEFDGPMGPPRRP